MVFGAGWPGRTGRCGVSPLEGVAAHGVAARGRPSPSKESKTPLKRSPKKCGLRGSLPVHQKSYDSELLSGKYAKVDGLIFFCPLSFLIRVFRFILRS